MYKPNHAYIYNEIKQYTMTMIASEKIRDLNESLNLKICNSQSLHPNLSHKTNLMFSCSIKFLLS